MKWQYDPKPPGRGKGGGLLRPRQPRRRLRRRHALLQYPRRSNHRARRRHRPAEMDHAARRHQQGRDDDDGAARRQGQGPRRQQRRRVRRARLADGARRCVRSGRLARLQHRPGQDVLIGPNFKPFYEGDRGKDLGITTWPGEGWRTGGGTVWGWISYDPELDLIFYGASNPGPWNPEQRPGDNKWTTGDVRAGVPTPAKRSGPTRPARTISSTTTASTSWCSPT